MRIPTDNDTRMRTVLVIDDNPAVGTALDMLFGLREIRTLIAHSPDDGLAVLAREDVDVVVQDMNFSADTTSGEEGVALFRAIRERHADLPIILLTAWTNLETAIDLVKAGASDYLAKPWDDHKLVATVENLLELSEATREVARFRDERRKPAQDAGCEIRPARHRVRLQRDAARHRSCLPGRAGGHSGADHRSRTAPARNASPRSCRPIRRSGTARSSPSIAARCRPN